MSDAMSVEIRVSVDVGSPQHHVAIGLSSGAVLEEFAIAHQPEGCAHLFARIETHHHYPGPVALAMEGYNGYARPLDRLVQARGIDSIISITSSWRGSKRSFRGQSRPIGWMRARG